jgi:hypothetical protein
MYRVAWRAASSNRVIVLACQAGNRFLVSLEGFTNTDSADPERYQFQAQIFFTFPENRNML